MHYYIDIIFLLVQLNKVSNICVSSILWTKASTIFWRRIYFKFYLKVIYFYCLFLLPRFRCGLGRFIFLNDLPGLGKHFVMKINILLWPVKSTSALGDSLVLGAPVRTPWNPFLPYYCDVWGDSGGTEWVPHDAERWLCSFSTTRLTGLL